MEDLAKLIAYYKACYQSDNRERSVLNFFEDKISQKHILNSAELLQGTLDQVPIAKSWGTEIAQTMKLYSQEKELICGSLFLIGYANVKGKHQKICAPLFIHLAQVSHSPKEDYFVEFSDNFGYINPAINEFLKPKDPDLDPYHFINKNFSTSEVSITEVNQLRLLFEEHFTNVNTHHLSRYPFVWIEQELRDLYENLEDTGNFIIVPALGLGVIKKSLLSRGVLNELEQISEKQQFSAPIDILFSPQKEVPGQPQKLRHYIPANLSSAQNGTLDAIEHFTNNIVIGPPGTGKSFTIAAIAVDAISKGKSILIAAKTNEAVDVIGDKLEQDFDIKDVVVRGGKSGYLKEMKSRIENLLSGIGLNQPDKQYLSKIDKTLDGILKNLGKLEADIDKRAKKEMKWGEFFTTTQQGFFYKIRERFITSKIQKLKNQWELIDQLGETIDYRNAVVREYVLHKFDWQLYEAITKNRQAFQKLNKALRARRGNKKAEIFDEINFKLLLKALPVWLVNASDINRVLPLQKELFDLVVMDEATQCDIASTIPLLYRAKKSVIVGDPKQLRHVSFLSGYKQENLAENLEIAHLNETWLDYRNKSILDIFSENIENQSQVHFLDEHYRSLPPIIQFSNDKFYSSALNIMTKMPHDHPSKKCIEWIKCEGKRTQSGYNKKEADELISRSKAIIEQEAKLSPNYCKSIGILSPFRAQADYLRRRFSKEFTLQEMERHQIMVGTPYAFQGNERDIMFLTFALDHESHPSAFMYLNREDVFNVAITRARVKQVVLTSVDPKHLSPNNLFTQYLGFIQRKEIQGKEPSGSTYRDTFSKEVMAFLEREGVEQLITHYPIAGFEVDLVVIHNEKTTAIDFVGYPGRFEAAFPIEKYKMLKRIGIEVVVIPYSKWLLDRDKVEEKLSNILRVNIDR